jgi:hypothetical protein
MVALGGPGGGGGSDHLQAENDSALEHFERGARWDPALADFEGGARGGHVA